MINKISPYHPYQCFKEIYMLTNFIRNPNMKYWCHSNAIGGKCSNKKHIQDIYVQIERIRSFKYGI